MSDYRYDHQTVQGFILSAIFWGVVGILIGLLISVQMFAPAANFAPWLTFGRLRPVHTNGLAFGLGVGAIFGLSYYIVMRLSQADPDPAGRRIPVRRVMDPLKRLRLQLTAWYVGTFALILLLMGTGLFVVLSGQLSGDLDLRLESAVAAVHRTSDVRT